MLLLGKESEKEFAHARGANAPFLVRNRTGYPLSLCSESSDDPQASTVQLEDGGDVPWRFDDWRKMREVRISSVFIYLGFAISFLPFFSVIEYSGYES